MDVDRKRVAMRRTAKRSPADVGDEERIRFGHGAGMPVPVAGLVRESDAGPLAVQRKLSVGAAHDPCEREADAVAREVVAALRGGSGRRPVEETRPSDAGGGAQRDVLDALRRAGSAGSAGSGGAAVGADGGTLDAESERAVRRARGSGQPLDAATRTQLEPLLGADLSAVRLHSGAESTALNEGLQASAFTVGSDVFFRGTVPDGRDQAGLELLAHELTHTVQQGASPSVHRKFACATPAPQSVQRNGTTTPTTAPTTAPTTPTTTAPTPATAPNPADVERALDMFAKRDGKKVTAAINAYAAKSKKAEEQEIGGGVSGSGKMDAGAQAGAYAGAEIRELQNGYAILAEAGAIVGASIKLEGELKRKFGKLEAKANGSFSAFVGAMVKTFGKVEIGRTGISAEGSAKGMAGVESVQNASLEFGVGDYGAKVEAEAREMAGAEFDAEGTFALKKSEIAIGGQFSAFAGAKVEGKVKTSGTLYGREAASLELTGSAEAGAGASAQGHFSIKRGVLRVKLGGSLTVGLGGGGSSALLTDFKPIAVWIIRRAYRQYWSNNKTEAKGVLDNPDAVKQPLIDDLAEYGAFKRKQLSLGKADNYVKEEKIQQYVNKHVPRAMVKGHKNAGAVDAMIKDAVETAFTDGGAKTVEVTVTDGKVKVVKSTPPSEYSKAKSVVTSEKTGRGLGTVTTSSKG